jgi:hypothetical protein
MIGMEKVKRPFPTIQPRRIPWTNNIEKTLPCSGSASSATWSLSPYTRREVQEYLSVINI